MKLPRQTLRRGGVLAVVTATALGATAFADTLSVTLVNVRGARTLHVTGATPGSTGVDPTLGGPAALSFGPGDASAPFGVMVTDVAYDRKNYHVEATLSNLYPLDSTTGLTCSAPVPAGAFTVDRGTYANTTDPAALVQSILDFANPDISANVSALIDTSLLTTALPSPLALSVPDVAGLTRQLSTTDLSWMTIAPGDGNNTFTAADAHPGCAGSGEGGTPVELQTGATDDTDLPGLDTLATTELGSVISTTDTMTRDHLPADATTTDVGVLWIETREALVATLSAEVLTLLGTDGLDTLTDSVVADTDTVPTDLDYSLIGQTGIYATVPTLIFNPDAAGNPATGIYHGVMSVTLMEP